MAGFIKVTYFFEQRNQGWSESYIRQGSLADTLPFARALGDLLIQFRGTETSISGFRCSGINIPVTFPKPRQGQLFPPNPNWLAGTAGGAAIPDSDLADTCMLMRCITDAAGGAAAKFIFWRGIPDAIVNDGGELTDWNTFFGKTLVNQLQRQLRTGNWGWLGTQGNTTTVTFASITQSVAPTGYVNFTFNAPLFVPPGAPAAGSGLAVPMRISGIVTPGNLNGTIPVVVLTSTSGVSKKRIAILPWDGQSGKATYKVLQFIPFAAVPAAGNITVPNIYPERAGERKAGRPFGTPPGRARNRVRA